MAAQVESGKQQAGHQDVGGVKMFRHMSLLKALSHIVSREQLLRKQVCRDAHRLQDSGEELEHLVVAAAFWQLLPACWHASASLWTAHGKINVDEALSRIVSREQLLKKQICKDAHHLQDSGEEL